MESIGLTAPPGGSSGLNGEIHSVRELKSNINDSKSLMGEINSPINFEGVINSETQLSGELNENLHMDGSLNNAVTLEASENYNALYNKPIINGNKLQGSLSLKDLGIRECLVFSEADWVLNGIMFDLTIPVSAHSMGYYALISAVERKDSGAFCNVWIQTKRISNGTLIITSNEVFDGRLFIEEG
ncbi:MAG: hypothetical protein RR365_00890 [Bacteroides sp.]